jgi:tape measure domain-containing protein
MAVQDAELKLKVSLDLAFFRQQLSGLGQAAAGYNVPINVRFDRRAIQNELNALGRNISQRTYRLEVATNISAEIKNAEKLAKLLREMPAGSSGVAGTTGKGLGQKAFLGISPTEIKRLYKAAGDAGLISFRESIANNKREIAKELGSIGKDSVAGLLNGLSSQNAQLQKAAESLGKDLIASVKGVLGIASPSREFRKIGEDSGKGFEQGLIQSMEIAEKSATRQLQRMLDRLARMALMAGGMSAAEISRQAGAGIAQRMMPGPSWTATTPSRSASIGPSSSGRLLSGAPAMRGLPGSFYGEQKMLMGDLLSPALKEVLRGAANTFVDSVRRELNSAVRSVSVRDLGRTVQAALSPQRTAGLLSAGVGRAPSVYSTGAIGGESREQMIARRTREAYMRSSLREMDVMGGGAGRPPSPYSYAYRGARPLSAMVPYAAGGALVPIGGGGGGMPPRRPPVGAGGAGGLGDFGRALGNVQLPGTGVVREIGNEFAMATKQVLLFGTAYKALAFATSFPAQVGQAVGALQSFNNTLKAISPTAQEARTSNQFILDIVDRYNVPLQSARDGFTKLYASMAPAGFKGDEIRALFTGVSQAAATFGMSAEKVDRVNYAFAQMASKGQVMSEELKGQLGDVLPGAMGIFAEAAGFEGPKAIEQFSKALEDGAYKGDAMRVLLKNVTGVLQKEFGPGAEGAARTFQGVINRMQNSTKLLYEAFEPVAVGFLNGVVVPLTSGLKTVADGVNTFLKGTQAETAGGFALAQELERLKPAFDGIRTNINNLLPVFQTFGELALNIAKILLQLAGNPVVGYLAKIYAIALPLNIALGVMKGLWAANALQLIIFNARVATGTSTLTAFRGMMAATGATAATTAASIRGAGLVLRTFFAATGVGLVITGVSMLIERFMSMNQALEDTKNKALGAAQAIRSMSSTEARAAQFSAQNTVRELQNLQQSGDLRRKGKDTHVAVPPNLVKKLESAGIPVQRDLIGQTTVERSMLDSYIQQQRGIISEADYRQRQLQFEENQTAAGAAMTAMPGGATGADGGQAGAKLDTYDRSKLDFIKQQGEQEKLALDRRLQQNLISETQFKIASAELELEVAKLELAEQLRIKKIEINKDNLSAQDKQLKILDEQTKYQNALNIAQDKYTVAVEGAKKELEGPFDDAIQKINASMTEQRVILANLETGTGELTPKQQATLAVQELITGKTEDELNMLKERIKLFRGAVVEQALLNKEVERAKKLRELSLAIDMARAISPDVELRQKIVQEGYEGTQLEARFNLEQALQLAQKAKEDLQSIASSIGSAFGDAFKGIITGTSSVREALAGMFQSIADSFADMVAQMIAEWMRTQVLQGFQSLFGPALGALGGGFAGGAAGFGGGFDAGISPLSGVSDFSGAFKFANGGIAAGGFRAFADGGIVTGPTLGLVGEGRYNEAVIPLPDGKSVPVELGGMAGGMGGEVTSNIVVNINNGQMQGNGNSNGSELGRKIEGAVKQVLVSELRPGGILSGSRR